MEAAYSAPEVTSCLEQLGIGKGDCLFVHSGLKSLGKFVPPAGKNSLDALLDAFVQAIGEDGTLVVPTFNFGFCKGKAFDLQHTPSEGMGAFSEFIRLKPEALRSRHPFQSVAAVGRLAAAIAGAQGRSAFAPGGAFDVMLKHGCKIVFFGVYFVETFAHVAEERALVPYRFWKTFTGEFVDGETSRRIQVDFFARKLELVPEPVLDIEKLGRFLRDRKIIASAGLGSGSVSVCNAQALVDELTARLVADPSFALCQG
jgi:aminoglycoside 3-N-acetyltransferase